MNYRKVNISHVSDMTLQLSKPEAPEESSNARRRSGSENSDAVISVDRRLFHAGLSPDPGWRTHCGHPKGTIDVNLLHRDLGRKHDGPDCA